MSQDLTAVGVRVRSGLVMAAVALLCPLARTTLAQEAVLVMDPAQTRVEFVLSDVLHTVRGKFKLKEGSIRVDLATGKASGHVVVDAASGDSGNRARDRKMHKEILESETYPEITIAPVRVVGRLAGQGESQVEMQGLFKIHGSEHDVSMTVSAHVAGDQLTAETRFIVPYVKWGMKNPSTFILRVSDKVEIEIHAVGRLTFLTDGSPPS